MSSQDINFYPGAGSPIPKGRLVPKNTPVPTMPQNAPASTKAPVSVATEQPNPITDLPPMYGDDPDMLRLLSLLQRTFGIPAEAYAEDPKCQQAVMQAAAMCLSYGFMPARHIRVRKISGEWVCEDGYRAWLDAANEMARQQRFAFDIQTVPMTDDEVKQFIPALEYTPGDLGYYARVLRSDVLAMYRMMETEYSPEYSIGFYKHRAYLERDANGHPMTEWMPDPIHAGRRPEDTARMRASKAALMSVFSLVELNPHTFDTRMKRLLLILEADAYEKERLNDPRFTQPVATGPGVGEDGEMLWMV